MTIDERIAIVETKIDAMSAVLAALRDNHLVHLEKKLDGLHERMDSMTLKVLCGLVGILITIVLEGVRFATR